MPDWALPFVSKPVPKRAARKMPAKLPPLATNVAQEQAPLPPSPSPAPHKVTPVDDYAHVDHALACFRGGQAIGDASLHKEQAYRPGEVHAPGKNDTQPITEEELEYAHDLIRHRITNRFAQFRRAFQMIDEDSSGKVRPGVRAPATGVREGQREDARAPPSEITILDISEDLHLGDLHLGDLHLGKSDVAALRWQISKMEGLRILMMLHLTNVREVVLLKLLEIADANHNDLMEYHEFCDLMMSEDALPLARKHHVEPLNSPTQAAPAAETAAEPEKA